jgi:hypothetical protein
MPPAKDYSNSSIYRIVCKDEFVTECYVGSTFNLRKRIGDHKGACKNPNTLGHNVPLYKFIRNHGGWENWDVVEVERVSCENVKQLRIRERQWFEHYGATLNAFVPNRSQAEWEKENREYMLERDRVYRHKNREQLNEITRAYRHKNREQLNAKAREKITCVCGSVINCDGKARHERTDKHKKWLEQQGALGEN